jgi:hypothetical protein
LPERHIPDIPRNFSNPILESQFVFHQSFNMSYKGSCLCGAVKFELNAEPIMTAICHCTDCQHEGGSFSDSAVFPPGSLKYTEGKPTQYNQTGFSGKNVEHNFCGKCGSTLVIMQEVLVFSPKKKFDR